MLGYNPALKPYPYNPERAKQLIAEAKAAGVPVETTPLTLIVRRGAYFRVEEVAEAIADMLQKAGLTTLKPQVLETAKFSELYSGPPKPIAPERGILGGQQPRQRAARLRPDGAASTTSATGTVHLLQSRPPKRCRRTPSPDRGGAGKAYQAIAQYVHDDFVLVPIGAPSFWYAMSQRVEWTPRPDTFILAKEMTLKE